MFVFTCEDSFGDIMTCVYRAWECAAEHGHAKVRLEREPIEQYSLFETYTHVDYEENLCEKVVRSVRKKISSAVLQDIYYASLSRAADAPEIIYRYLVRGFAVGSTVRKQYTDSVVARMMELCRNVGNEAHYFREFARFTSMDNRFYVCHLEPKNDVIWLVGRHFADRMPSEYWMIIDDNRRKAVVHPKDEENIVRSLNEEEWMKLSQTDQVRDEYTDLWLTFFDAIAIEQRKNPKCQQNHIPLWMRKHATEFQRDGI